jgi:hypothetical protein
MKPFKQEPAFGPWNIVAREKLEPVLYRPTGDARSMERRAIERWENEGGEIPKMRPIQFGTSN